MGNVHEGPHALNGRNTTVFKPGMIVTDEPGVYEGGVWYEKVKTDAWATMMQRVDAGLAPYADESENPTAGLAG